MAVEVRVRYEGGLNCRAEHGPSGDVLVTTAPVDNGGDGSHFSPTDLVATGLATCVLTIMAMAAERHGIDLAGTTARVEKHMSQQGLRRIARLPLTIELPFRPDARQLRLLEAAAHTCPVHRSLGDDVEKAVTITWKDDAPAARTTAHATD